MVRIDPFQNIPWVNCTTQTDFLFGQNATLLFSMGLYPIEKSRVTFVYNIYFLEEALRSRTRYSSKYSTSRDQIDTK